MEADRNKQRLVVIAGPTASGKSALAEAVCLRLGGEIISCDSMQIYRKMNIGTAKPGAGERAAVRYHLIDICEPDESFSAADFVRLASAAAEDIISRGMLPVLCGGTGLYLDSLMHITSYTEVRTDLRLRQSLMQRERGELWRELERIDPQSAAAIHENNVKRVARALEIYYTTGKTKTELDRQQRLDNPRFEFITFILAYRDRQRLYDRINSRVTQMLRDGLENEVRSLLAGGLLRPGTTAYQAIGYKELISYINGDMSYEEAVEALCQATRNYAKRQTTWFSRYENAHVIEMDGGDSFELIVNNVVKLLTMQGITDII